MLKFAQLVFWILIGGFWEASAYSLDVADDIDKAVAAYDAGDHKEAAQLFEQVIAAGHVNGHVYYDLGNTYYRLGEMGAATAAYLAAINYLPRSPDVLANLNYARQGAIDKLDIKVNQSWWAIPGFWAEYISTKELAYALACTLGISALLWMLGWIFKGLVHSWRLMAVGAWVTSSVLAYGLAVKALSAGKWGAVVGDTAQVFSGPNEKSNKKLFELHEAAPILVEQRQGEWRLVQISDGKKGWIKESSLKVF